MVLQLAMDMAGTFPILGYLLIKAIFKKRVSARKYIWMLRLSIILYLCPFQQFKYAILPSTLTKRFELSDFWGIVEKKIGGFEVVNIPTLVGSYYVVPKRFFDICIVWLVICAVFIVYHYGTYFFIKRKIKKSGIKTEVFSRNKGRNIEVFQTYRVKTPCTVGWIRPEIFLPEKQYDPKEKEWLLRHELTHIRHRDIFWKFLALICCVFHWYNPFVYYLIRQYSTMCEYYCDAECMQDSNIEEKKNYALFLIRSAAVVMPRRHWAIVQGLTNNGEKMKERVDRILDEDKRPEKRIRLLIAGIFIAMCMCSFMTIFVYSATPEQDVPAEDNTFTEAEWDYFYGKDISDGDEKLDFSKSALLFQKDGEEVISVLQSEVEKESSDVHKKEVQKRCVHSIEKGTLKIHTLGVDKTCRIKAYDAQRCEKCEKVEYGTLLYTADYAICSHNMKQ